MTYFSGKVTNAGWRKVRPQPEDWTCACGVENKRYLVACSACKAERQ